MPRRNFPTEAMLAQEGNAAADPNRNGQPIGTFNIRDLSVLAYANGFTLWHYKTDKDTIIEVEVNGFFAGAADMMARGDMVLVTHRMGGSLVVIASVDNDTVNVVRMAGPSVKNIVPDCAFR